MADAPCGTTAGYQQHRRLSEQPCDPCREANKQYMAKWRADNIEYVREADKERYRDNGPRENKVTKRNYRLCERYGITLEQFDEIFDWQGNVCKCCGTDEEHDRQKPWQVDHNHDTRVLRGIVCSRCNRVIAQAGDDAYGVAAALTRILAYLAAAGDTLDDDQIEQVIEAVRGRRGLTGVGSADPDRAPRERHEKR